ncbi:MAG TPA: penicillin acylase family protein [Ramlibacter sp.]|nr:penicillin acylase family protein [Ramlibacter sp.]
MSAAVHETRYRIPGLAEAAEIRVDRWGVPHLRAATRDDLFFLQGFNAARDRLWQLDLWRKRGLGLLSADFGPGFLAQDRAARLFLYRGDMQAEWDAYGVPGLQGIVGRFVAGINAYIALCEARPELLPPEFDAMDTRPQRWAAEDVVRIRSHALVHNLLTEVMRARVLARADLATDLVRRSIDPPHEVQVPEGFDPASIPDDVLDVFQLACAPVHFSPARLAAKLEEADRWSKVSETGEVFADAPGAGSNNWAVSAGRSATGRPILATDPHRVLSLPSIRYVVHLSAPGIDAIGAGEPALPGISFGHNGHAAFAMTMFSLDQEDLYVYATDPADPADPADPLRYRYGEGWERFEVVRERIAVRDEAPQDTELMFSRHGPVIWSQAAQGRAIAVRTVWSQPGTAPYLASLGFLDAKNHRELAQALRHWGTPGVNFVCADTQGDIAWHAAGLAPRRPNWDGLLPVPGDGRYEWNGFTDARELPQRLNPQEGFIATANEMNIPADYPSEQVKLGFEFQEPARARRIHEVLRAGPHSMEAACALQTDDVSGPARRLVRLLPERIDAGAGRLLREWDGSLHEHSAAAALFEVWWTHHLKPALLARAAPDLVLRKLLGPGDHETLLDALEAPGRFPWLVSAQERDAVLRETLTAAWQDCAYRMGADAGHWAWGRLHHGYFTHPLAAVTHPGVAGRDVGPLPLGGSISTPMKTHYRPSDFRAITGASFRAVFDVGNWDGSRFINTPGQSGDPRSPHYDDLAAAWAAREYRPLLYSRAAVDGATHKLIRLVPA